MMINQYYLQSNDFVTALRNVLGGDFTNVLGTITPFIVFGIILASFAIIGVIVYRGIMVYRAFGEGEPLGKYRIINMSDGSIKTGFLSKRNIQDMRDDLDDFNEIAELRPLGEKIIQNIEAERLNLYDFNIFDWGNAVKGRAKRMRILSNTKLELDSSSTIDQTGSRSWRSFVNKEYVRNVVGYVNSKEHEIVNPDRNIDGYISLAVIPKVSIGKTGIIMTSLVNPDFDQIIISPSIIENSKEIEHAASFLQLIAEGQRRIRDTELHTKKLQELLSKEQQINLSLKMKVNHLRRIILQQIVVGYSRQLSPLQQVNSFAWIIGCGVATLFGALVVPNMDGIKDTNIPNWLVGGAAMFVVIIIKYIIEQRQKPLDTSDVDERPENSELIN